VAVCHVTEELLVTFRVRHAFESGGSWIGRALAASLAVYWVPRHCYHTSYADLYLRLEVFMNLSRLGAVVEAGSPFGLRSVILLGLVSALVVQAQEALPPIQFNVPYRCPDGTAYVIQRCEPGKKQEVCYFHIEANGRREDDRYNVRSQFTDMMKRCPVSPAAAKPAAEPGRAATPQIGIPNRPAEGAGREGATIQQLEEAMRQLGNPPSGAAATQKPTTPAKPPAAAVGPPDPDIAKARAANVDTKLFGIPLGEPLALPKCSGGVFGPPPTTNCIEDNKLAERLVTALLGVNPDPGEPTVVTIQLTEGNCPTWLNACSFNATIQNGRFVAAVLSTKGRDVEAAAGKELRGKYGQRASMQQRFITPNNGGAKFEVWDLDWDFPGLHVEYKVVNSTILDGFVLIESETLYAVRKAKEREAAKPKL
jgi:hypothetical protein